MDIFGGPLCCRAHRDIYRGFSITDIPSPSLPPSFLSFNAYKAFLFQGQVLTYSSEQDSQCSSSHGDLNSNRKVDD